MKILTIDTHSDMCGGLSYEYKVSFSKSDITVLEALNEINNWELENRESILVRINGMSKSDYWKYGPEKDGSDKVISVYASGGWYTDIELNLETDIGKIKIRSIDETIDYYAKQAESSKTYATSRADTLREKRELIEHQYNYNQLVEWLKEYKEYKEQAPEWTNLINENLNLVREYKEDYKNAIEQLKEAKRLLKLANSDAKSLFGTNSRCKYCSVAHNKEKCAEGILCMYQGVWRYADEIDAFLEEEGDE